MNNKLIKAAKEVLMTIVHTLQIVLLYINRNLNLLLPYIVMYLVYIYGMNIIFVLLILILQLTNSILTRYINNNKSLEGLPIPTQRFTTNTIEDEIVVDRDRLQELILFVYQYEEWLNSNGKI